MTLGPETRNRRRVILISPGAKASNESKMSVMTLRPETRNGSRVISISPDAKASDESQSPRRGDGVLVKLGRQQNQRVDAFNGGRRDVVVHHLLSESRARRHAGGQERVGAGVGMAAHCCGCVCDDNLQTGSMAERLQTNRQTS
jgi:hypothetical protein